MQRKSGRCDVLVVTAAVWRPTEARIVSQAGSHFLFQGRICQGELDVPPYAPTKSCSNGHSRTVVVCVATIHCAVESLCDSAG